MWKKWPVWPYWYILSNLIKGVVKSQLSTARFILRSVSYNIKKLPFNNQSQQCGSSFASTSNLAVAQSSKTPGDAMGDKRADKSVEKEMTGQVYNISQLCEGLLCVCTNIQQKLMYTKGNRSQEEAAGDGVWMKHKECRTQNQENWGVGMGVGGGWFVTCNPCYNGQ